MPKTFLFQNPVTKEITEHHSDQPRSCVRMNVPLIFLGEKGKVDLDNINIVSFGVLVTKIQKAQTLHDLAAIESTVVPATALTNEERKKLADAIVVRKKTLEEQAKIKEAEERKNAQENQHKLFELKAQKVRTAKTPKEVDEILAMDVPELPGVTLSQERHAELERLAAERKKALEK